MTQNTQTTDETQKYFKEVKIESKFPCKEQEFTYRFDASDLLTSPDAWVPIMCTFNETTYHPKDREHMTGSMKICVGFQGYFIKNNTNNTIELYIHTKLYDRIANRRLTRNTKWKVQAEVNKMLLKWKGITIIKINNFNKAWNRPQF
jgi:hypothetical protein